ncbi:MAG TPA: YciI family protein [Silvibacterium sp.]|nr:YciI family protein [Silvibacterium sp.]
MPSAPKGPRNPDVPRNLKPYFFCLLRRGERWNVTEGHEDLMPQYLAYLRREMEARRMIFAGPATDDGDIIAVAVLQASNAHEAMEVTNENPGVKSGHFVVELHPCLLPALDELHVEY